MYWNKIFNGNKYKLFTSLPYCVCAWMYISNEANKDKLKLDGYAIRLVPIQKFCNVDLWYHQSLISTCNEKVFSDERCMQMPFSIANDAPLRKITI